MNETVQMSDNLKNKLFESWQAEKQAYEAGETTLKPAANFSQYLGECLALYYHIINVEEPARRKQRDDAIRNTRK